MSETSTLINFHHEFPRSLRPEIVSLLRPLLFLIPEIYEVKVYMGEEDSIAEIVPARRYHIAHLKLNPSFFDNRAFAAREEILIHELLHIKSDIYVREAEEAIRKWAPEAVQEYVLARLEDREDELVDDLAHIIAGLLTEPAETSKFEEYNLDGDIW